MMRFARVFGLCTEHGIDKRVWCLRMFRQTCVVCALFLCYEPSVDFLCLPFCAMWCECDRSRSNVCVLRRGSHKPSSKPNHRMCTHKAALTPRARETMASNYSHVKCILAHAHQCTTYVYDEYTEQHIIHHTNTNGNGTGSPVRPQKKAIKSAASAIMTTVWTRIR